MREDNRLEARDAEVKDREAGLAALRKLKTAALDHDFSVEEETRSSRRSEDAAVAIQRAREHERCLGELCDAYRELSTSDDVQARGYSLEDLLKELFALFEIRYRKSYRTDGEQVDGFFTFAGFDYLVEARWRKTRPTLGDLTAFKGKVERKIESTRGVVVSIAGFDEDIVRRLKESGSKNLILIDGYDLALLLEGRVSLIDGLQAKVDKAAQEGDIFFSLAKVF